jgi:hypothetical protein
MERAPECRPADRPRRRAASLVLTAALTACAADRDAREPAPAPTSPILRETRTGVPVLMDLPGIGWLFRRTTTAR